MSSSETWPSFSGHYPDPIGPVTPGIMSLAHIAATQHALETNEDYAMVDIASVGKVRWKLPLLPNDKVSVNSYAGANNTKRGDLLKESPMEGSEPQAAVETHDVRPKPLDSPVSTYTMLEFAAQTVGAAMLSSMTAEEQETFQDRAPYFLGADRIASTDGPHLEPSEFLVARVQVTRFDKNRGTIQAEANVNAAAAGGARDEDQRRLVDVGKLLFGFAAA